MWSHPYLTLPSPPEYVYIGIIYSELLFPLLSFIVLFPLIIAKCFRNAYLATKVAFFNQMFDYCNAIKCCPNQAIDLVTMDDRIGTSHSKITEERGYGGHCFPKDMNAIKTSARYNKVDLSLIEQAIDYNKKIRST